MSAGGQKRMTLFLLAVGAAVFLAAALSVLYGSMEITFGQVVNAVIRAGCCGSAAYRSPGTAYSPYAGLYPGRRRLSAAGSLMQGVTRNPLADSGLLGINAGASFALALCLAFLPGLGFTGVVIFSFLGASVSMLAVYGLMSMRHRKLEPVRLVLAGSAVSIFLSSLSQAVSIFFQIGYDLTFWTAGGAAGIRSRQLLLAGPVIVSGLVAAVLLSGRVSMLSLGEDAAKGLGLEVERSRFLCLLTVLLLAGGAVALTGPVAFVGLLVPHVVRFFTGADYRAVIPCSMAAGAFFMLTADIISRTINAPAETPIGLIFSLIGVPFFIWIARKEDKGFD